MQVKVQNQQNLVKKTSRKEEQNIIENAINGIYKHDSLLKVLEAGCGRKWTVNMSDFSYHLTGVDLDSHALDVRKHEIKDLDEAIVGDLRTVELRDEFYDVIYSAYVLEHIHDAKKVVDNFFRWLKPGGIIILRIPDRDSAYGFITRITPHWFHILFYKYIRGLKQAGQPGYAPYPVAYEPIISSQELYRYCDQHNYTIISACTSDYTFDGLSKPKLLLLKAVLKLMEFFSLGKLTSNHINLLFVIRK